MTKISDLSKGYTCECGKFHKYPLYVCAHWDNNLLHTCDCGTVICEGGSSEYNDNHRWAVPVGKSVMNRTGTQFFPDWIDSKYRFERYLSIDVLPKRPKGHCRWCGQPVQKPRRSWCSDECVQQYMIRSNAGSARMAVLKRDKGICAACGIDCLMVRESIRWMYRNADKHDFYEWLNVSYPGFDPFELGNAWQADHIVPVSEGGGCCGLENLRTLCSVCHKLDTAQLAARLAANRRFRAGRGIQMDVTELTEASK